MHQITSIAIIGGGFSGICTAIHLILHANKPCEIYLIEKQPEVCKGIAYGTTSPYHPLNVRAGRMGVFADQPEHFYSWLEANPEIWRNIDPIFHSLMISPDSFLPRRVYSIYLQNVFKEIQTLALKKGISCQIVQNQAINANLMEGKIEIILEKAPCLIVDRMVLAVGAPSSQGLPFETTPLLEAPLYITNMWNPHVEKILHDHFAGSKGIGKKILVIGSGLTAVDALFTLHSVHYQGNFHFISKHGIFPEIHPEHPQPLLPDLTLADIPEQLTQIIQFFKQKLDEDECLDWRQLFDAFRHCTQALWQSFPLQVKRQFMRHLFFLWNKHRHRMSPQSHDLVRLYERSGALVLASGNIQTIMPLPNGRLQVDYIDNETNQSLKEEADCVINCAGPNYKITHHQEPLIQQLLKKQMIIPDDMGLGIKLNQKMRLAGLAEGKIFALGALLLGELLETTAVPEIRVQADAIARILTS